LANYDAPSGLLVVIPVYNHGKTLADVVERSLKHCPDILVIDDGSTDGGAEGIEVLGVSLVRHSVNKGKGAAIMTAAREAARLGKTHILTIDADGQHDPDEIPLFFPKIEAAPLAIVVGIRDFSSPNIPRSSKFGRRFSNFWLRVQTGTHLSDVQSGFRAYPVRLLEALSFREKHYSFEVEVLVKAAWAGFDLLEVDVSVYYPPAQERISHFHKFKDNVRISYLNFRLTARSFIPAPHRKYGENEDRSISPIHPMRSLRILLSDDATPGALATAAALGMLIGALPLIGLHSLIVVFVAGYFGLNKLAALGTSQLCIPPFVPAFCIEMGHFLRQGRFLTDISLQTLGFEALDRIWEWILGSCLLAPLLAGIVWIATYVMALIIKHKLKSLNVFGAQSTSFDDGKRFYDKRK
jgi:glycosyltransferase involved in cell wall biosynthesis